MSVRALAFYLPQFHPIPENDEWWGIGFTEWTNTARARPLYRGHRQPQSPADLGFYDLRVPEARKAQADLARAYGLGGFCYYHYWFAGRRILERPFNDVLLSGEPDFPFCLAWANQSWTGIWHGAPKRMLIEQTYPGEDDHRRHFEALVPAFTDRRYIRVDGKPVFLIYAPLELPNAPAVIELWRKLAEKAGLPGLYLVGQTQDAGQCLASRGFDACVTVRLRPSMRSELPWYRLGPTAYRRFKRLMGSPEVINYADAVGRMILPPVNGFISHPCVIPNWDNTPRSGRRGLVLHGSTPQAFERHLTAALDRIALSPTQEPLLFIKSWNEWAEGNYLEPDARWGRAYLETFKRVLERGAGT